MKKITLIILLFFCFQRISAQTDTLYLLIENPIFGQSSEGQIGTGFAIKSKDKKFLTNYYRFKIENLKGIKKSGELDYISLKDLRKVIDTTNINYINVSKIGLNKQWWELHDELSSKKTIYLVEKINDSFNSQTGVYSFKYYILPMRYTGTRKNVIPTDLSSDGK
ncbi:hypothetical protein [Lacinutrix jangbogonensis]|uniref:hypothetical protein n=1 Tax=Lacinutrix jangbogonensis TaxID=1469557 RepID=UPI00053DA445|nr:hypothetical protein [Lacinutrix jangbogonensis]